jgi:two-component system, NarL family, sensor kinase
LGAEANLVAALAQLKPLNETGHLLRAYNTLGVVAIGLEDFDRALDYFKEARYYLEQMQGVEEELIRNANNMGMVYRDKGDFEQAILYFKEIVDAALIRKKYPALYAKALSNMAFCRLQMANMSGVSQLLQEALAINDSLGNLTNMAGTLGILAEYHLQNNDTTKAIQQAGQAIDYANKGKNFDDTLDMLAFLSQVDAKNASRYAQQYIFLNDSLQREERQMLNRFARIRFETDEFIAQNEQLAVEKEVLSKEKQLWAGLAFGFLLLGGAIYIIITQRIKNQRLKFQEQQQANNQEIFNLMLAQKQKVDDAKRLEQKRISEELHDGVLGKMLGARMVLTGLNKRADEGSIQERAEAITALKNVENEIRAISHEMSHNAYQKINNFINSIATYLQSVEKNTDIKTIFVFDEDEDWDGLLGEIKINVYRMVQEALQNAIKHASCENFFLTFALTDGELHVQMKDDGLGFHVGKGKKGIGMRNISSRIEKLNGRWDIRSAKGKGTEITLHIPVAYVASYLGNTEKNNVPKTEITNQH